MRTYCITEDIKKVFLWIRISKDDRDAQRILWYDNVKEQNIVEYRCTRVILGTGPNPYIFGATLEIHISNYNDKYPETVKVSWQDTYVDEIQFMGDSAAELLNFKVNESQIMEEWGNLLLVTEQYTKNLGSHLENTEDILQAYLQVMSLN